MARIYLAVLLAGFAVAAPPTPRGEFDIVNIMENMFNNFKQFNLIHFLFIITSENTI